MDKLPIEQTIFIMEKTIMSYAKDKNKKDWSDDDDIEIPPFGTYKEMSSFLEQCDDEELFTLFEWFQHLSNNDCYPVWLYSVYCKVNYSLCVKEGDGENIVYRDDQIVIANRMLDIVERIRPELSLEFEGISLLLGVSLQFNYFSDETEMDILPRLLKADTPYVRKFISNSYYFYPKKYKDEFVAYMKRYDPCALYLRILCFFPYQDVIDVIPEICSHLTYNELTCYLMDRFERDRSHQRELCMKLRCPYTKQEWLFIAGRIIDSHLLFDYYNRKDENSSLSISGQDKVKIYRTFYFDYSDYWTTANHIDVFWLDDWMNYGGIEMTEEAFWKYVDSEKDVDRCEFVSNKVIELMNNYIEILNDIPNMDSQEQERYSNLSNAVICNRAYGNL